ncbi:hypothetical protein VHUM_04267 [Vanrija humicola]|uniref:Uncharacterized protein n=1 Tax=Vanrija humicola TaxID=5417 RepID=A0A7D8YZ66_VANHU|nr:hypothetical protein VHUM_04267 [Vanrija humicola]
MPNPFGMFGSDAGPSSAASTASNTRAASPAQPPAPPLPANLRRPASHGRLAQLMVPGRPRSSSTTSQEAPPGMPQVVTAQMVTVHADDLSSGRATPEQRRRTARVLASDAKYKKFAAQVDKCLQSFENVNEWADFISFLSRLLKVLQTPSPPYSEIPRKLIVAKRLAQCLNPALPSGVHARALDVYSYVFSIIGVDGLRRDLLIWSSGLFPFFQNAATSVRPALINIYETYYLPLKADLRPATKALSLALLPGVEEETGDFFDQVLALLNKLSDAVTSHFFLQTIFLVMISSPASRLASLNYLAKVLTEPPADLATARDSGLVIRGVAAVLGDDNMLVRRGGLDLLQRILPLNGAILKEATEDDRFHLTRAVTTVVLARDVSLSRRVYAWFLGTAETSEDRVKYFKTNGLALLTETLSRDMDKLASTSDFSEGQAPFKVFLALLDKWEVGESLSENLALPALRSIRAASSGEHADDIQGVAVAVDEAIEPSVLWKQMFDAIDKELPEAKADNVKLAEWLTTTVPQRDEETVAVYLPVLVDRLLKAITDKVDPKVLGDVLALAASLLSAIPDSVFAQGSSAEEAETRDTPLETLIFVSPLKLESAAKRIQADVVPRIVTTAFKVCEQALISKWAAGLDLKAVDLVRTLIDREVPSLALVKGADWLAAVLVSLGRVRSFAVVDSLVDAALRASRCRLLLPPIVVTTDSVMTTVLNSLFRYLGPDAAAYHARAVELIWEYNQLAEPHTLESVIARRMSTVPGKSEAFAAFGVLWRQSDDTMLPGEIFQVPMLMILDGLKSEDPQILCASESWMRCNLKSYFRMVDPLLRRLIDMISGNNGKLNDAAQVTYLVSNLSSLFRFGGQGLSKACQSAKPRKSPNAIFVRNVEAHFADAQTYLDLLTDILSRLLKESADEQLSLRVQSAALELLQHLVSRGDLSLKCLGRIKKTLVDKLTAATKHRRLTLQNTMLHLLHTSISGTNDAFKRSRGHRITSSSYSVSEKPTVQPDESAAQFEQSLIDLIIVGISSPGNRPILQHWVDFVLMTIPHLENRPVDLRILCDCFCEQLRMTMLQLRNTFEVSTATDVPATITEAEPIMLIQVLERLAVVLGSKNGHRRSEDRDRQNHESGGLLGYLPTVFSVEAPQDSAEKCEASRYLDDIVEALLVTWTVTADSDQADSQSNSSTASKIQIMSRTRTRARKALEKLFESQPSEVLGSCIQVWAAHPTDIKDGDLFDCVDTLAPTAQKVVDLVCEHLSGKGRGSISDASSPALLAFLEAYISRLEGPIAIQVWNTLFSYSRDVLNQSSSPAAKAQLFPVLRCLTILGQIVSTTSALEDKRLRRDLQDTYVKVLDAVVSNSSRVGDSASWRRGRIRSRLSREVEKPSEENHGVDTIYQFIASPVLPNLRTLLVDNDRVSSVCSTVSSNMIVPAFKQNKVDNAVLNLLREMTKIPPAVKSWRLPIGDAFNDNRFFKIKPEESGMWKPLVRALFDSDKERLIDLLGRISAAPSANIFTNRELETISRSLNLRRLSVVLLAAERNHFLAQLPMIQEKLVEILRTNIVSPRVHSEVYLCLRVMMCRYSPQHLTNFWPIILAELLRVLESTMDDPPADGSEDLLLVLAASKFLDLLLVIQSEDFQIHQWIFVTDTTDAAYPPEDYNPEALMDRLAEVLAELGPVLPSTPTVPCDQNHLTGLRRPHLKGLKTLTSLQQLSTFFSRASIDTFEGVYADTGVDWEAVEDGLNGEIFEGE